MGDGARPVVIEGDPNRWIERNQNSLANVKWLQLFRFNGGSLEAITKLHSLVRLELYFCEFEQLRFGELPNLTDLTLDSCTILKCCIPDNPNLKTLILKGCSSLVLPSNLEISNLILRDCFSLKFITPFKLHSLNFVLCPYNLKEASAKLDKFVGLNQVIICACKIHMNKIAALPQIMECSTLAALCLHDDPNLQIKALPWRILPQLKLLILPRQFRLETLPNHINDSVVICTHAKQGRKTLKELIEDGDFSPIQDLSPDSYLRLESNPSPWKHRIDSSKESQQLVRILELELSSDAGPEVGLDGFEVSIGNFDKITHLYISSSRHLQQHIPSTFTRLKHLSLIDCIIESFPFIVSKISLEYLHLDLLGEDWPNSLTLPITLRHLCLQRGNMDSLLTSLEQLTNLKRLDLYECYQLCSIPQNLKIFKLRLINSNLVFKSVPSTISHLEVIHFNHISCGAEIDYSDLDLCLKHLINLESLFITCPKIKLLPTIKLHKLKVLKFRDCFSLTQLPEIEETRALYSLDLSGTRITFVPDSLLKLPKLQLILPKCLAIKLTEVSIIDETDELYYQLMGFYNITLLTDNEAENVKGKQKMSLFLSDGVRTEDVGDVGAYLSNMHTAQISAGIEDLDSFSFVDELIVVPDNLPHTDDVTGHKRKITKEEILEKISKGKTIVEAASEFGVSRSTVKRRMKEFNMSWQKSSNQKQLHKGDHNQQHTNTSNVEVSNVVALNKSEQKHKQLQGDEGSHSQKQLQGGEGSNVSTYYQQTNVVEHVGTVRLKSAYKGDLVRIDFPWTSNVIELNEILSQKFGLQENKFKVLYPDEDNELMLLTDMDDLRFAFGCATSLGQNFVRLVVEDK